MRAWGIDVYSGTNLTLAMLQALRNIGMTFVVVKASMGWGPDPKVVQYSNLVKQAGLKLGLYHWSDNTNTAQAQAARFSALAVQLQPDFISLDDEQWWNDWEQFWQACNGQIPWSAVDVEPGSHISAVSKGIMDTVHASLPNLWFWHYGANWFINAYCLQSLAWINDYPMWLAEYTDYNWNQGMTFGDRESLESYLAMLDHPVLPAGCAAWTVWQISGRAKLPGVSARQDLNIFNGTATDFAAMCVMPPPPVPPPPPPPATVRYYVSNASGTYIQPNPSWYGAGRYIAHDAQIDVDEIGSVPGWWKVYPTGWVDARRVARLA
jgi:GH25 family lysozyme M1 (1,4-beta-N-acetylmuramidase)